MDTIADNQTAHNQAQQLFDRYTAIMSLRDVETDRDVWMKLDHEARKTWQEWLHAAQDATMRSDKASYSIEQGG